ncbi:oligosaccharide flippase family protein [Clostridium sp. HBUAS56017]|uniref:oligosaccharide flippase family protein n=1 Tax=Clostridium sp. HBUAS56017 TaxID=2571128 RepID=UPI001178AC65|nr:oligosaccharide flippase family protein [Clostridium sp. HBUAS56017]
MQKITRLKQNKDSNIIANIIVSFILKFLGLGLSYLLVPITIGYVNNEQYGIWMTLLSIISWISFSDIGLGNGLRNKLTESLAQKQLEKSREYISTAYAAMTIIVFILLVVLMFIIPFLNWQNIFNTVTISNSKLVNLVVVVLVFFLGNFILSLYSQLYYAKQQSAATGIGQLLVNIISVLSILILKRITSGDIVYLGFSYGVSMILPSIFLTCLFFKKNAELRPALAYVRLNKFKEIIGLGVKFFIIQIAVVVYFGTNNIIIAQVCGPNEVTNYNVVYKLFSLVNTGHILLITPLWSAYTEAYGRGDIKWIRSTLNKTSLLLIPIGLGLLVMTVFSDIIFKIWLGNNNIEINKYLIVTMAISTFITVFSNTFVYFLNGVNEIKLQMYNCVIVSIINIPLCIYFSKYLAMGSTGIMLAQILTAIPFSVIAPLQTYHILRKSEEVKSN